MCHCDQCKKISKDAQLCVSPWVQQCYGYSFEEVRCPKRKKYYSSDCCGGWKKYPKDCCGKKHCCRKKGKCGKKCCKCCVMFKLDCCKYPKPKCCDPYGLSHGGITPCGISHGYYMP